MADDLLSKMEKEKAASQHEMDQLHSNLEEALKLVAKSGGSSRATLTSSRGLSICRATKIANKVRSPCIL